jgi:NAD(P)H-dependent FMN reductase
MLNLGIVVASVREGRAGLPIAHWCLGEVARHGAFSATLLDLRAFALPLLEEPAHPRLGRYSQQTTRAWSAAVAPMDAFVFVTPEYNYGSPPALINALDHLYAEWHYKPVGFVSYGGISGGLRSVQMTKLVVSTLRMMPLPEAVTIPFFSTHLDAAAGTFTPTESPAKSAGAMLDELARWAAALSPLRGPAAHG